MPTPPPSPEKTSQLQERLRYYENEISDMSKELEQTRDLRSQLGICRNDVAHLQEIEKKLNESNFALKEEISLLEIQLKDNNSELINAQFEVEKEKATTLLMKEEGNEKNKMLQNALETNVKSISYIGIITSFYILTFWTKTVKLMRGCDKFYIIFRYKMKY